MQMLQLQPELLAPHMHEIIEYMLASTQVRPPFICQLPNTQRSSPTFVVKAPLHVTAV